MVVGKSGALRSAGRGETHLPPFEVSKGATAIRCGRLTLGHVDGGNVNSIVCEVESSSVVAGKAAEAWAPRSPQQRSEESLEAAGHARERDTAVSVATTDLLPRLLR